jgi:hypothetical protein
MTRNSSTNLEEDVLMIRVLALYHNGRPFSVNFFAICTDDLLSERRLATTLSFLLFLEATVKVALIVVGTNELESKLPHSHSVSAR